MSSTYFLAIDLHFLFHWIWPIVGWNPIKWKQQPVGALPAAAQRLSWKHLIVRRSCAHRFRFFLRTKFVSFFFCVLRAVVIEPVGTRSSPVQRLRHELHTNPYITQFEWFSLFVPIDDRCLPSMSFDCIGSSFSFLSISLESIKGRHLIKIVAPFPKQHIKQTKEARTESLKNRNETELIDHPNVLKKNYNSVLPICKRWGNPTTNTRRMS